MTCPGCRQVLFRNLAVCMLFSLERLMQVEQSVWLSGWRSGQSAEILQVHVSNLSIKGTAQLSPTQEPLTGHLPRSNTSRPPSSSRPSPHGRLDEERPSTKACNMLRLCCSQRPGERGGAGTKKRRKRRRKKEAARRARAVRQ